MPEGIPFPKDSTGYGSDQSVWRTPANNLIGGQALQAIQFAAKARLPVRLDFGESTLTPIPAHSLSTGDLLKKISDLFGQETAHQARLVFHALRPLAVHYDDNMGKTLVTQWDFIHNIPSPSSNEQTPSARAFDQYMDGLLHKNSTFGQALRRFWEKHFPLNASQVGCVMELTGGRQTMDEAKALSEAPTPPSEDVSDLII